MASSRAILIDLEKNKLDPAKPHTCLDKSGHLVLVAISAAPEAELIVKAKAEEKKPVVTEEPAVVKPIVIDDEPVIATQEVESPVEEPQPQIVDEKVDEEQAIEESQPKRRGRRINTRA